MAKVFPLFLTLFSSNKLLFSYFDGPGLTLTVFLVKLDLFPLPKPADLFEKLDGIS